MTQICMHVFSHEVVIRSY